MKKKHLIAVWTLIVILFIACNASEEKKKTIGSEKQLKSVYKTIDLNQKEAWKKLELDWQNMVFNPCLKEAGVTIDCANCTGVYMDVVFFIDNKGHLESYEIINFRFCKQDNLESCLMKYFTQLEFSEEFFQTTFQVRLGRLLKC